MPARRFGITFVSVHEPRSLKVITALMLRLLLFLAPWSQPMQKSNSQLLTNVIMQGMLHSPGTET